MTSSVYMQLLRPHYDAAARYCRLLCAPYPAATAEDVFQQALVTGYQALDGLVDRTRFRPWFFRIIYRAFLMERRRQTLRRMLPLSYAEDEPSTVYDPYERLEWKQTLMDALARLPAKARTTLLLHEVAGFNLQEIGCLLGDRSLSATKMRLKRARRRMQELLVDAQAPGIHTTDTDLTNETIRIIEELGSDV